MLLFSLFSHLLCASSTFSDTNTRKRKQQLTCSVPQWWSSVSVGQSVHSPVFCSLSGPCGQQTFLFLPPLRQQQDVPRLSRGLEGPLKGTLHPFMANANSLRHGDTSSSNRWLYRRCTQLTLQSERQANCVKRCLKTCCVRNSGATRLLQKTAQTRSSSVVQQRATLREKGLKIAPHGLLGGLCNFHTAGMILCESSRAQDLQQTSLWSL